MARRDIEFDAEGVTLRGWFYPAEGAGSPGPAVVMAHGFSAVKEMYLDSFAEVFAAAGLNVLTSVGLGLVGVFLGSGLVWLIA